MLEVFRIARDLAVADHQHRMERSSAAKSLAALDAARGKERPDDPPTLHELFVTSYRFMTSELSTLKKSDQGTTVER